MLPENSVIVTVSVSKKLRSRKTVTTLYRSEPPDILAPVASAKGSSRRTRFKDSSYTSESLGYRAHVRKERTEYWSKTVEMDLPNPSPPQSPPASPPQQLPWSTRSPAPFSEQQDCPAGFEELVLEFTNQARSGLIPLQGNHYLTSAARAHTRDMARSKNLSHEGWFTYIQASGFEGFTFGENIAAGFHAPDEVVRAWFQSSGHRANMLNPSFTQLGVGCIRDENGRLWWTQDFGG